MRLLNSSVVFCSLLISSTAQAEYPPTYTFDPYVRSANNYFEDVASEPEKVPPLPMSEAAEQPSQQINDGYVQNGYVQNGYVQNDVQSILGSNGCADGSCDGPSGCNLGGYFHDLSGLTSGWYGSAAGLIMTRDMPDRRILTSEIGDPTARVLSNRDADIDWEGGFEVIFGRCITNNLRWEAGYWGVGPFRGSALVVDPTNSLISTIDLNSVDIGPDAASDFFDASAGHSVYRDSDVQNIEFNMIYRPGCFGACGDGACGGGACGYGDSGYGASCSNPWSVELLAGIRYFRFEDFLRYGGVEGGASFGDLGGMREAYMQSDVENHLIGFQIGALIDYNVARCWTLYARPKFGIYGNSMNHNFNVRRGDELENGYNWVTGDTFPARSNGTDVSFLAEVDLGVRWDYNCHWSAFAAYRAVAVTGVALSDDQFPTALADIPSIRAIDSNGSLVVHGLVAGLQFQF
jgi:hypothetical protein